LLVGTDPASWRVIEFDELILGKHQVLWGEEAVPDRQSTDFTNFDRPVPLARAVPKILRNGTVVIESGVAHDLEHFSLLVQAHTVSDPDDWEREIFWSSHFRDFLVLDMFLSCHLVTMKLNDTDCKSGKKRPIQCGQSCQNFVVYNPSKDHFEGM
jgi:hypothetical protein